MKILLVGTGGYAVNYVNSLLSCKDSDIIWEGIVDPYYSACPKKAEIDELNIPVYNTMDEFYKDHSADLAVISTPPYLHCEQSVCALSHGSNVLCEKPIAPTVAEGEKMLEAEEKYGKFIAIGYQWSFAKTILELKKDILSGLFGKPISLKTSVSWPRNKAYYNRTTGWGGKISKNGVIVLDSIASNACAHYLHNMFFILGSDINTSASVTDIKADCFRANDIENFDTCTIKMKDENDTDLYFIASHAADRKRDPEFIYEFENAVIIYSPDTAKRVVAKFRDGSVKDYGDPFADGMKKLWDCVDAVKAGTAPACSVKTALTHTRVIEYLYKNVEITDFPRDIIHTDEKDDRIFVDGLFEKIYEAYEGTLLLSDVWDSLIV